MPKEIPYDEEYTELSENVVAINRVSKMTKGGRTFKLTAWVVVGDGQGKVGVGRGSGKETPAAIEKAKRKATKNMRSVILWHGTLPHPVIAKHGATRIIMKPAAPGTGIKACQPARAILEAAGYKNVLTKVYGGGSVVNILKATMKGLLSLKDPVEVAESRGKDLERMMRRFSGGRRKEIAENNP
jgi:small subunit ribosomal protein S5